MKHTTAKKTIRSKLLTWFITTITVTFLLLGGLLSGLIWQVLHDQIDHHLHTVISEAEQVVNTFPLEERDAFLRATALQQGMTVTIIGPDGKPLLETNSPEVSRLSEEYLQQLLTDTPPNSTIPVHFNVGEIRFATLPITLGEGNGLLAIGYSLRVIEQTFQKLIAIIMLSLIILLGITVYGIQTILYRYLQPLEMIANKADQITYSQSLALRVPSTQETAELQMLTSAFNQMLSRLQQFFKTEQEFFSNAAHTLKTPLAIVRSYIETTPAATDKTTTLKAIDQTNETIEDLLLLSRMNTHAHQHQHTIALSKITEDLIELATVYAQEKQITVNSSVAADILIQANESLIKRALSNLIHNAIQYTPEKGAITISLTRFDATAQLTVTDTGIGIPKDDMKRVFERFYRGSNTATVPGSGLGLAIVKAIVEAAQGSIFLDSTPNKGTSVTIRIPAIA